MKKFIVLIPLLLLTVFGFGQSRYISSTTKKIVYARDGGKCQCCGSSVNLEYDHIKPYSCGGRSDRSNIQLLCQKCNRSKSNGCYCKVHSKKVGIDCCQDRSGKVRQSSAPRSSVSRQCTGTTQKGMRCRRMTTNSSGRCYQH